MTDGAVATSRTPSPTFGVGARVSPPAVAGAVALVAVVAAVTGFVLSTADAVHAADVVRLVLLCTWAFTGVALARGEGTAQLGAVTLAGTMAGALRSIAVGLGEHDVVTGAVDVAVPVGGALVVGAGIHLLATMPSGEARRSQQRLLVAVGYIAALVVGLVDAVTDAGPWTFVALGAAGTIAAAPGAHRRYVASRGVVRQRLQWLGLAVALVVESAILVVALDLLVDWPPQPGVTMAASLVLVALALAAGSSRRLVGRVEGLLQHAVSLAGSSAVVVATYVVVVVGLGRVPTHEERTVLVLSMLAAAVAALAFVPARERLTEIANRLVYGEATDPTEALETFGQRMTRALPMDELLLQLAELLKKHLDLTGAEVWKGTDGRLERVAAVPSRGPATLVLGAQELPVVARVGVTGRAWATVWLPALLDGRPEGPARVAPMTSQGEVFGLIVVERGVTDDDFTEGDDQVLAELARQVGLALKNSSLDLALQASLEELERANSELRRSRARIVASADAERRKIERNLHDGAQQHLVALAVKLRLIERVAAGDIEAAIAMIEEARTEVQTTVDELRTLAHGIYPPLLMDRGLAEAFRAAAARSVLPTTVTADGVGRYDQDVEAAVYFCVLEAMQNAGKHAGESATLTVVVTAADDDLRFEVCDTGVGFELDERVRGHGFVNMADRLGAIGGSLELWSAPGQGTRITGRIQAAPLPH